MVTPLRSVEIPLFYFGAGGEVPLEAITTVAGGAMTFGHIGGSALPLESQIRVKSDLTAMILRHGTRALKECSR